MGERWRAFREWVDDCNISTLAFPVGMGGRAMMVAPQTVFAHLMMLATGESHDDDCNCAVCTYRADDSAAVEVASHRAKAREWQGELEDEWEAFVEKSYQKLTDSRILNPRNGIDEIDESTAAYWAQAMSDMFPQIEDSWTRLFRLLEGEADWRLYEILVDFVLDNSPVTQEERVELYLHFPDLTDPQEGQGALEYLVNLQYVSSAWV